MGKIDNIFEMLKSCDIDELTKIKNYVNMLLSTETDDESDDEKVLYTYLTERMKKEGVFYPQFYAIKSKKQIRKKLREIISFLFEMYGSDLTQREKMKLFELFAELLVGFLIRCNIPVSFETVYNSKEYFIGELDRAFPWYSKNVLKILVNGGDKKFFRTCVNKGSL
ncbi:MAG TPA: hypothetical protein PLH46_00785 [Caldisericia bacterium]|nr:hypothetical protein [Caldisericia bacterium]